MSTEKKPSKNEAIKEDSVYLKGNIAEEVADTSRGDVSKESYELLKFHGTYQQFDRDKAEAAKKAASKEGKRASKEDKEWIFMVRMKLPGGLLQPEQYLALDTMADQYAASTLRITTRQTFQFHFVIKEHLKDTIATIHQQCLTTMGGCGDVVRNVICSPAPIKDAKHKRMFEDANLISDHTLPKTSAFHEIWVDGENVGRQMDNEGYEPLYGKYYMPRKFKIGIALPEDNSVDALTHDLAIFPIWEGEILKGYNLALGGGMGMTHNKPATYPRLASQIAFVPEDKLIQGVEAVIKLQRDHGDRSNRKHARLKYVVEENGLEWTFNTLQDYYGEPLNKAVDMPDLDLKDHMGWHEQGDGKWYLGVPVSSGRIIDNEVSNIKSALKKVIGEYNLPVALTPDQNIILCEIEKDNKDEIETILRDHRVQLADQLSSLYRTTLACVSLPTCGLALAEAERVKIPFVQEIEGLMNKHGIEGDRLLFRISGCPNGCSRPYACEIGIVGRMPGHYAIFIGGDYFGTRMNTKILDRVPSEYLKDVIDVMLGKYVTERQQDEMFGDYCHRIGETTILTYIQDVLGEEHRWAQAVA